MAGMIAYQNLLYDPGEGVTVEVTCDKISGNFDTFNLYDMNCKTLCKIDASTGAYINFTFSQPVNVNGIFLLNHNLVSGQDPKFQAAAAADFSPPALDEWFTVTIPGQNSFYISTPSLNYRYFRVYMSAAQIVTIGQAFLLGAPPYTFAKNFRQGSQVEFLDGQIQNITDNGSDISSRKYFTPKYTLPFNLVSTAQKDILVEAARYQYVLFNRDTPDNYQAKYGKITQLNYITYKGETYEKHDINLDIKELPQ
jgi:hypothetical protein